MLIITSTARHALAVAAHDQALREDGTQVLRHVEKYLVVLLARKHVDDAIQGLRAVVGVERGQHQVPPFRRG